MQRFKTKIGNLLLPSNIDPWSDGRADFRHPETRKVRRGIIEKFRGKHGNKQVAPLQREHIEAMLAEIAKPSAKGDWLKAIRALLRFAVPTMLKADPTLDITN
jgi:hypothetical protein